MCIGAILTLWSLWKCTKNSIARKWSVFFFVGGWCLAMITMIFFFVYAIQNRRLACSFTFYRFYMPIPTNWTTSNILGVLVFHLSFKLDQHPTSMLFPFWYRKRKENREFYLKTASFESFLINWSRLCAAYITGFIWSQYIDTWHETFS